MDHSSAPQIPFPPIHENTVEHSWKLAEAAAADLARVSGVGEGERPVFLDPLPEAMKTLLQELNKGMNRLCEGIDLIDAALNRAQPALPGKLRIHWLSQGKGALPAPTLVQWLYSKSKRTWYPKKLTWGGAGSRAKYGGAFHLNYAQTRDLLTQAERLVMLRRDALSRRRALKQSVEALVARVNTAAEVGAELADTLLAEAQENLYLRKHG